MTSFSDFLLAVSCPSPITTITRRGSYGSPIPVFRFIAVTDEVAAVTLVPGQQVQHEFRGRFLVFVPVDLHAVAGVDQEADYDGLRLLMVEEIDFLFLVLIENSEIALRQIRHEATLVVGYGDRHDD